MEARRAEDAVPAAVVPIGELAGGYDRPAPALDHYDDLLAEVAS